MPKPHRATSASMSHPSCALSSTSGSCCCACSEKRNIEKQARFSTEVVLCRPGRSLQTSAASPVLRTYAECPLLQWGMSARKRSRKGYPACLRRLRLSCRPSSRQTLGKCGSPGGMLAIHSIFGCRWVSHRGWVGAWLFKDELKKSSD